MEGIRIIELPPARMATSGDRELDEFDTWWSNVDRERTDRFYPRDFMWFDEEKKRLVWFYALPDGVTDSGGYDVANFPGGLYAAAVSRDQDDTDGERVYAGIKEWVKNSGVFDLDEGPGHYAMFHVITPDDVYQAMGFRQLDIYVPVKLKLASR
jgi:hypothetical protein